MKEGFNPNRQDIIDEQGHKKEIDFSYADKRAVAGIEQADKMARLMRLTSKEIELTPRGTDILYGEAINYDKKRKEILKELEKEGYTDIRWHNLPEEFKTDEGVIIALAKHDGLVLEDVEEELQRKNVILVAVNENAYAYIYIHSEDMKGDHDVAMTTMQKNGMLLGYAPDKIKDDKEIVLEAIKHSDERGQKGYALKFASQRLRDDIDVVLTAVELDPKNIEYAGLKIQDELKRLSKK